jgi:hypothetical protein
MNIESMPSLNPTQQSHLDYFLMQYSDKEKDGLDDLYDLVPPNERNRIESDFELYLVLNRTYPYYFKNLDPYILYHLQIHFKNRPHGINYNQVSKKYPVTNEQKLNEQQRKEDEKRKEEEKKRKEDEEDEEERKEDEKKRKKHEEERKKTRETAKRKREEAITKSKRNKTGGSKRRKSKRRKSKRRKSKRRKI